jgi:hypothetical protein
MSILLAVSFTYFFCHHFVANQADHTSSMKLAMTNRQHCGLIVGLSALFCCLMYGQQTDFKVS